ncbi:transcriptional regulator GutM [Acetobacterium bakii]|uniref:transcriptional regulator GutM n=1 Tax=Acetobacterium bakii TaxID=52689 RepID=UPI00068064AE|nr:transcriptional regulator GutM [Acetobacterium bakii]
MIYLAFAAFVMMVLQSLLTYFQYRNYQKAVDSMREKGKLLGIGLRKGGFNLKGGSIVILGLDRDTKQIVDCKKLEGIAIWKRFEAITLYNGLSLKEVREIGIAEDYEINRRQREKAAYSLGALDKKRKKGALIQAIEALDKRLLSEATAKRYQEQRNAQREKSDETLTILAQ